MKYDYVKAILYAYPSLGEIGDAVKVSADNKALLSYNDLRPAADVAGDVAREIALRLSLAELASAVERMLGELSEEENYLLEYKYFRRKRVLRERYARFSLGCTERHYFRKQNRLLVKAADVLTDSGWTKERFLAETGDLFSRVMEALGSDREYAVQGHRKQGRPQSSAASS